MYREVDRTQAIEAAFDRRPAFMITEESGSLRFYDLSEELYDVVNHLHEPRFIVDMPDDADIEGKKAEENTPPQTLERKSPANPGEKRSA